ncbi:MULTISPECIES: MerR family transcriptional regulator [unclassified Cryobacterium]|uniref:MerR family transcriptional regulator n=1 Tax=unclassified Cryobacterium TaxID=2649013 RepID=UPI00106C2186|nr:MULTISPECIES: MerR family transcriptional regulator [unclassified Cryobacterium]TFC56683.1 MerR family transcriptional regulator [Cryobacterium sp. TMB3-1-2]TFC72189.1 MerR family transcriptional regulator [Cryobacterium sp. TMB3-15]TFC78812.1 MerR family transcriptional regulator [Cryobacterium sp. TMB3-10]TFD38605.1 MerR family transcriptional regulator [Cryobacterium sp. TMB3-12]
MDHSIQDIARLAGTTSRTLRHYGAEGLLPPSRIAANGYRYYDDRALVRLQRILLLRALGLGLPAIRGVLDRETDEAAALRSHLGWLEQEQHRLQRQIRSVRTTITALERKDQLMAEAMFDGFDHTTHREEVEQRWGADAYAGGDRWWRGMSPAQRAQWQATTAALQADWQEAAARQVAPAGAEAQELARRHVEWLDGVPGIPRENGHPAAAYVCGLGEMYVADDRFAAHYGGQAGAGFVRDALAAYLDRTL